MSRTCVAKLAPSKFGMNRHGACWSRKWRFMPTAAPSSFSGEKTASQLNRKRPFLPPPVATLQRGGFFDDGEREKNDSGHAGGRQAVQGNISGAGHRGLCTEGIYASAEKAWCPEMCYVWETAARKSQSKPALLLHKMQKRLVEKASQPGRK